MKELTCAQLDTVVGGTSIVDGLINWIEGRRWDDTPIHTDGPNPFDTRQPKQC